jgi:hypothetical protein
MAGQASIENGKKGGRPKAAHTIQAEQAKALLISMYLEKVKPINEALLKKAEEGDIQAIRELHDRVWGKSPQAITGESGGPIKLELINYADDKTAS